MTSEEILWVHLVDSNTYRPLSEVLELLKDDTGKVAFARFKDGTGTFKISPQFSTTFDVEIELRTRVIR